jgi:dihydroorotase
MTSSFQGARPYKGDIESESRAAVAGGITSFIEQPNTVPNAVTQEILKKISGGC